MKRSYLLLIRISLLILITLIILGYGLFQARDLIKGPEVKIFTPENGESTTTPVIVVSGIASNITGISLDDRPIFIDKLGNFSEELLLQPGYNIMKVAAQDKFGRTKVKLIELNYAPIEKVGVLVSASSTNATSSVEIIQ